MKKLLFALILLAGTTLAFADKSRFYENGSVIDTMYVDSKEGLRVRDKPSLKSNKICGLPHRLPVKVVAIGKEDTIDGITAPWVEILIPRYEWKGEKSEFGWIFGGYLSRNIPSFETPKNAEQLKQYLEYSCFNLGFEDGGGAVFYFARFENNIAHVYPDGWTIKNDYSFRFSATGSNTLSTGDLKQDSGGIILSKDTYKIDKLMENEFICYFSSPYSLYAGRQFYPKISDSFLLDMTTNKRIYAIIKNLNILQTLDKEKYSNSDVILNFIKIGISADNTSYEQMYHVYWNPIMAEHQKQADEMN